jgi:biotin carboxyl carrier protein
LPEAGNVNLYFWLEAKEYKVGLRELARGDFEVTLGDGRYRVLVESPCLDELLLNIDGKIYNVIVSSNTLSHSVFVNGRNFKVEKRSALRILKGVKGRPRRREIKISMPGRVVAVLAAEGETVREGQAVLVVEAMKMQNEMKAPQAGRVTRVYFGAGEYVEAGAVLFTIE